MSNDFKKRVAIEVLILSSIAFLYFIFLGGSILFKKICVKKRDGIKVELNILEEVKHHLSTVLNSIELNENDNEIYQYFKANRLTDLDQSSFLKSYSNPEKAKDIYNYPINLLI